MDFKNHLKKYLSDEDINKLLDSLKDEAMHGVLLNTRKMDDETFLKLFPDVIKHPIVSHAYLYNRKIYNLGKSVYHTLGCFYLQEPSAMVPAYLLNAQEDDLVLDMCAAPGGKSVQTSFLMNNTGLIISNDLSKSRAFSIVENVERLGIGNIVITNNDLSLIYNKHLNTFDKIILDAPCSGSGMFRKEDKMMGDWTYNKVLKFAEVQKQLILIAYSMLKSGGTLVYSTCSFSYEEDEEVIKYLLDNTDACPLEMAHPLFYKDTKCPLGVHLFPSIFPGEGHYICLINKPGNYVKKNHKYLVKPNKFDLKFENLFNFSHYLFGLNYPYDFKDFNVIRLGVKIGEEIKDEIRYDYHYAHYVSEYPQIYDLNDDELKLYFNGDVIPTNKVRGYTLLKYQNISVDIAKADGRIIKNHFPKAFRHKID